MTEVQLYFVIPKDCENEDETDAEMQQAFNQCEQHRSSGILAEWIAEKECFTKSNFTKRDVFVLQEFRGRLFNKLLKTKAVIVGSRCLSCCLIEGSQIPPGPQPVYTIAMRGLIVTASGLDREQKERLKNKISWMGGRYDNILTVETTHLISNTIFSDKYHHAVSSKIPIMHEDWVDAVWAASLEHNVSGSDSRFDKHKLPTFYGAIVTTSGFTKHDKKKIVSLINGNGGTFKGVFESAATDIVVMSSEGIGGDKYKAAVECNKYCVLPAWVQDSVARGCALNPESYKVFENKTSSPNQNTNLPDMSLDLSTITNLRKPIGSSVDDTCSTTVSTDSSKLGGSTKVETTVSVRGRGGRVCALAKEAGHLVDSIEMKEVKQAGAFLDGCCIYTYGFTATRREKLHRIVSRCGGVRYDFCQESVTHAICGDPSTGTKQLSATDREAMPRAIHVTVKWLVDSMKAGHQLDENQYVVTINGDKSDNQEQHSQSMTPASAASPMSKRNLQLLQNRPSRPPVPLFNLDAEPEPEKDDIVLQYMEQSKLSVGDSEDALANYFKQGGTSLTKDQNVTLAQEKTKDITIKADIHKETPSKGSEGSKETAATYSSTTTSIRVMDGEDKTLVSNTQTSNNDGTSLKPDASTMTEASEDLSEIFKGLSFELQGMEESAAAEIAINIDASGGRILPVGGGASYVVVPLDYDDADVVNKKANIVTTFWLDDCLSQQEIVGIEYYHRPVKVAPCVNPLSQLTLGISTYVAVERIFIDELARLLGAVTQVTFCRRSTATGRASTHLICPEASGAKYTGALKWGLPAVTSQWLLACALKGRRVREGPYLVGDTKEPVWDYDESMELKEESSSRADDVTFADVNNKENISVKNKTSVSNVTTTEDQAMEIEPVDEEPAEEKTTSHVEEDLTSHVEEKLTSHAEEKLTSRVDKEDVRRSIGTDSSINIKLNTTKGNTPKLKAKLSLGGSSEMSPVSRFIALARQGLPDSQESPKRVAELCKESKLLNESVSTPPMDNALATPNLALFSPTSRRRLLAIKRGEMPSDPPNTPRNPFESSVATPDSPFGAMLRPGTGHMSGESKKKLLSLCKQLPSPDAKDRHQDTPISELSKKFFSRYHKPSEGNIPLAPRQLRTSDTEDTPPAKQRKLSSDQTPENKINSGVENQLKQLNSILLGTSAGTPRSFSAKRSIGPVTPGLVSAPAPDNMHQAIPSSCGGSQAYTVGWDDMSEGAFASKTDVQPANPPKIYKFILSQNVTNRSEVEATIERLGGTVVEGMELDLGVTHMLHTKPAKSEKILSSIAAGIWLLHPSYITKCNEAGHFVEEEEYEWGNPLAVSLPQQCSPAEEQMASAGHRWRLARLQGRPPPFHSYRLLLHVTPNRRSPLVRLVVSGGGVVLDASPPYTGELKATHCVAELNHMPLSDGDKEWLVTHRVPLCPPTFISKVLIDEPQQQGQDPMMYAYPAYRKMIVERYGEG